MTSITVRLGHDMTRIQEENRYFAAAAEILARLQRADASVAEDVGTLEEIVETLQQRHQQLAGDLLFIDKHIARITRVVDGVRGMVRRGSNVERVAIAALLDDILEDCADRLAAREIRVRREYGDGFFVLADGMELYSIFFNLIKNAIEAMAPTADRPNRLILRLMREYQMGEVRIVDTGVGMEATVRENVFTMGFTTKGRAGTGIGLNIAHKLVLQYSGALEVTESVPGAGTTMAVRLPLAPEG